MHRLQWHILWVTVGVIFVVCFSRTLRLMPLYLDPELRSHVQALVTATAKREGWLLSDVAFHEVSHDAIWIEHHAHHRGKDERRCFIININTGSMHSCKPWMKSLQEMSL